MIAEHEQYKNNSRIHCELNQSRRQSDAHAWRFYYNRVVKTQALDKDSTFDMSNQHAPHMPKSQVAKLVRSWLHNCAIRRVVGRRSHTHTLVVQEVPTLTPVIAKSRRFHKWKNLDWEWKDSIILYVWSYISS